MRKILGLHISLMLVGCLSVTGQDSQFSQFYASPLYINPAFAGSLEWARVGANYRNQWPGVDANFNTFSAWGDVFIEDKNSGLGVIINHDRQSVLNLRSTSLSLQYAYDLRIAKGFAFRAGAQASIYNRSVDFNNLIFGDQFDPATGNLRPGYISADAAGAQNRFFGDFGLGGLLYSKKGWLGFSASHINRPNQSIIGDIDRLPVRYSLHGGVKFQFRTAPATRGYILVDRERSISPSFQYKHQGSFDQLDLGAYFTLEPIIVGVWYRGIPIKKIQNLSNNESVVLMFGFVQKGENNTLSVGYSFDYTVSRLGIGSGGAHEISIVYAWSVRNPRKPPRDQLRIPCPQF